MKALKNNILFLLVLLLLLTSCEKDEHTLPAKVNFEFELISYDYGEISKTGTVSDKSQGNLEVNHGTLNIGSIEFDGRREQGKDIYFESNFSEAVFANLSTGQCSKPISFDIPQGVYKFIEINLNLLDNNGAPLMLEGTLRRGMPFEDDILIRFEYPIAERIRIKAEPKNNTGSIVIKKDVTSTFTIKVDAGVVFRFVNMNMLMNAEIFTFEEEKTIIINQEKNNDIFNLIASQVEKSFTAVFK